MTVSPKSRGIIEWSLSVGLPLVVVIVTAAMAYGSLRTNVQKSCEKFAQDIARIEAGGTSISFQNSKDIVGLQVKFETIDQRLKRIEDGQQQMISILSRRSGNNAP